MVDSQNHVTNALVQFLAVAVDGDTYRRLLYLLIACPLAVAYFVGTSTGLSVGVGLSVVLVGIPILLVTLVAVTGVAWFEAYLAHVCLDRDSSTPVALTGLQMDLEAENVGYYITLKRFVADPSTWASLGLVAIKSVFGLLAFVILVTLTSFVGTLIAAPLFYNSPEISYRIASYSITTLPEAVGLSAVGVLLGLISLHLVNAMGEFGGYLTKTLLAVGNPRTECN